MNSSSHSSVALKEFFLNLYNGHSSIAERTDASMRELLHVETDLEERVETWLKAGKDVILTGRPGDGKTHLLQYIDNKLRAENFNVEVELDASQKNEDEIIESWSQAHVAGKPFFLAVNHAPLRELARRAEGHSILGSLSDAVLATGEAASKSEIINFVVYSADQQDEFNREQQPFMLIDLSHRASLTDEKLIKGLINKLAALASNLTCSQDDLPSTCSYCPIKNNATLLKHERVQQRFLQLFKLLSQQGSRTSVRDLLGFFVYTLTRGVECKELWGNDISCHDNDYYNLAFDTKARNNFFEQLRHSYDPGHFSDPQIDIQLWNQDSKISWIGDSPTFTPKSLDELRQLKRRYFFEGEDSADEQFGRTLSKTSMDFKKLLGDDTLDNKHIADLIEKINKFYAPSSNSSLGYRSQLRLWDQHRYAVGNVPGYFAMRSFSAEKLVLYRPRLNQKYVGSMTIYHDHVLLGTRGWLPGDPALRIDWGMYQALSDAQTGKRIETQPFHILRRLDLFLRQLGTRTTNYHPIETIEWSERRPNSLVQLRVNRISRNFEG